MTRKKIIIIIITTLSLIFVIILGTVLVSNLLEQRRQQEIIKMSNEFTKNWANFKDETSAQYLDSISGYLSNEINKDYTDTAGEIISMRGDNKPVTSSFTITKAAVVTKNDKKYTAIVVGNRNFSDERGKAEETIHITWEKIGNKYVITDIYSE